MNSLGVGSLGPMMPIVMAFDDNYLVPALVSIFTARKNSGKGFRLIVVYDPQHLSRDSQEFLSRVCLSLDVNLQMISHTLPKFLRTHGHFTSSTYSRLFIPKLVAEPFVYIDADTICEVGWDEIADWDYFERQNEVGVALRGVRLTDGQLNPTNSAVSASKGRYLSAGVLVFDPPSLENGFEKRVEEACKAYERLGFQWVDQCVLNYVMGGRVQFIDPKFNVYLHTNMKKPLGARILHFVGSEKPWIAVNHFRNFFTYPVQKWWGCARQLSQHLEQWGFEKREFGALVRRIATSDGVNPENLNLGKKLALPIIHSLFSKL